MEPGPSRKHSAGFSSIVERNIEALVARRDAAARNCSAQERFAQRVTDCAGSMAFVWLHLVLFGLWIILNSGLLPIARFDPTLVILAMFASVEAIFFGTKHTGVPLPATDELRELQKDIALEKVLDRIEGH